MQTTPSEQQWWLAAINARQCTLAIKVAPEVTNQYSIEHRSEVTASMITVHLCRCTYYAPGMETSKSGKPTPCAKGAACLCCFGILKT